jgi:hypothetical protein
MSKQINLKLVGWKAYFSNKIYRSESHNWLNVPKDGMICLQRFFEASDKKDKKTYYELVYGQPIVALSVDRLKEMKRLPREFKFMKRLTEEDMKIIKEIEEDG